MGQIRKLNLIVSHTDIVDVLSELISLSCLEPTEPNMTLDPPELTELLKRETIDLNAYEANMDSIEVLATQYTYFLTGWLPSAFESELASVFSKYACAWEVLYPRATEADLVPAIQKFPQVLGKLRSGGRKVFEPLSKARFS